MAIYCWGMVLMVMSVFTILIRLKKWVWRTRIELLEFYKEIIRLLIGYI